MFSPLSGGGTRNHHIYMKKQLILASSSPRRKMILEEMGVDFRIEPSDYEEIHEGYNDPKELVRTFALEKAKDVQTHFPEHPILGADTIVVASNGEMLGKAKSREEAYRMVALQQGKENYVITAVALLYKDKIWLDDDTVILYFDPMSTSEINAYLDDPASGWQDKAGAYAAQWTGGNYIRQIEGEFSSLIGLPKSMVQDFLMKLAAVD